MNRVQRCRYGEMIYMVNDVVVGRSLDLYGEYSEGEVALFRELLAPGQTVVDVGANIGAHTVPLAQRVSPGGCVLALEPQRLPFYCLCANVVLNNLDNVLCQQAAAGRAAGSLPVPEMDYREEKNFGALALNQDFCSYRTYTVPVVPLDALGFPACHFLKIDVEGMETEVLLGAKATLRRFRPVVYVEDNRPDQSPGLRALLEDLGYELYTHQPPLYNPMNYFHNPHNRFGSLPSWNLYGHPRGVVSPVNPVDFHLRSVRDAPPP